MDGCGLLRCCVCWVKDLDGPGVKCWGCLVDLSALACGWHTSEQCHKASWPWGQLSVRGWPQGPVTVPIAWRGFSYGEICPLRSAHAWLSLRYTNFVSFSFFFFPK